MSDDRVRMARGSRERNWADSIGLGDVVGGLSGLAPMATAAGRGAISTTLGAPKDLSHLADAGLSYMFPREYSGFLGSVPLPGSEDVRQSLGGLPEATPYETLGGFAPINPTSAVKGTVKVATKVVPHVAKYAKQLGVDAATLASEDLPRAIKNGLARAAEQAQTGEGVIGALTPGARASYAVKPRGGNWDNLRLTDQLEDLKRANDPRQAWAADGTPIPLNVVQTRNRAVNAWIDSKLKKYIMTDLGTATDPLLELEKQGITHFNSPEALLEQSSRKGIIPHARGDGMFVNQAGWGELKNEAHKTLTGREYRTPWENLADAQIMPDQLPADVLHEYANYAGLPQDLMQDVLAGKPRPDDRINSMPQHFYKDEVRRTYDRAAQGYGWLAKPGNENQRLHVFSDGSQETMPDNLNFSHIIDYLHQSDLTPEQIAKVNVPDAVRMTHKWNGELAKKMEADQAEARMSGATVHKEYPDGFKWVQIGKEPEHLRGTGDQDLDWNAAVEKGLKAEGDTMGHCVGGYCDDVLQGNSSIYSLRDAKGNPHVTVETGRDTQMGMGNVAFDAYQSWLRDNNLNNKSSDFISYPDWAKKYPELVPKLQAKENILQIKGKQNAAPVEQYLPYVQDFVRSQPWGRIGDFGNTGLHDIGPSTPPPALNNRIAERFFGGDTQHSVEELRRFKQANPNMNNVTEQEVADWFTKQGYQEQ